MRLITKNEMIKEAFLDELKREKIKFSVKERLGYEAFVGYMIEGTLEEIGNTINSIQSDEKEVIHQGFWDLRSRLITLLNILKMGKT